MRRNGQDKKYRKIKKEAKSRQKISKNKNRDRERRREWRFGKEIDIVKANQTESKNHMKYFRLPFLLFKATSAIFFAIVPDTIARDE